MQLTSRERIFIIIGLVFIISVVGYLGIRYGLKKISTGSSELRLIEAEKAAIIRLGKEYQSLKSIETNGGSDPEDFDKYIEALLVASSLADKYDMRRSESTIQSKFAKRLITISIKKSQAKPVLDLIYILEKDKGSEYKLEHFSYRSTGKEKGFYRFTIKIASFQNILKPKKKK